jgi:NAD(P)H-dependent flavin oxidoreductase YrpB (nitropropane dioxygenase family)
MRTAVSEMFGLDSPIFAFSHCRDVVAAATRAGGMGVLGASTITPENLEAELAWIDSHSDGKPYGVDLLIPSGFYEISEAQKGDPDSLLPKGHLDWVNALLKRHNVPELPPGEGSAIRRRYLNSLATTPDQATARLETIYRHPRAKFIVSALGVPPAAMIERAHSLDLKVGSLIGRPEHAPRQVAAGVDVLIAQGHEAGGHTGDIASMVLVPEVVDLVDPVPVLAAGGVGRGRQLAAALALGAQGVWCGTIWLGTSESETSPELKRKMFASSSSDTDRSRSNSGKPARRLKSAWISAWNSLDAPPALPMPLHSLLVCEALERIARFKSEDLLTYPAGQIVGHMRSETSVKGIFYDMLTEFSDTMDRLNEVVAG